MPVKRRRSKRRGDLDPAEWSYVLDEPMPDDTWGAMAYFALDVDASGRTTAIWSTHGEAAVEEYAAALEAADITTRAAIDNARIAIGSSDPLELAPG